MRRVAAVACIAAACGGEPRPAHVQPPRAARPPVAAPAPAPAAEPAPVVQHPPPRPPVVGPPNGEVIELAVTADGGAALGVDDHDGVYLWPTLDGSREPVAIDLPVGTTVALAARPDGFAAALLDAAGGLVLARLDRDGGVRARVALPPEPAIEGIAAVPAGLLAWRADGTLALYGDEGELRARVASGPGEHVHAVVTAGARALAVLAVTGESGGARPRARTVLADERGLRWGEWRDPGPAIDGELALSPDGETLARVVARAGGVEPHLSVIALATGRERAIVPLPSVGPAAFFDDAHVMVAAIDAMLWVAIDGGTPVRQKLQPGVMRRTANVPLATSPGVAITAVGELLVLARPDELRYLGYGMPLSALAAADGRGGLVVAAATPDTTLAHLDRALAVTETLPFASTPASVLGLVRASADTLLVQVRVSEPSSVDFVGVDIARRSFAPLPTRSHARVTLTAEPTTGLVGLTDERAQLARYDAAARTLTELGPPVGANGAMRYYPLAPALAGGERLVRATEGAHAAIEWLRDERSGPTSRVEVAGRVAGVDRAGHAYVSEIDGGKPAHLAVLRDGQRVASLPASLNPARVWPDGAATRVVLRTRTGVQLYGLDGEKRWEAPLPAVGEVVWLDDATIAVLGNGVVLLDAATGAVVAARCGWAFGLSTTAPRTRGAGEHVCAGVR